MVAGGRWAVVSARVPHACSASRWLGHDLAPWWKRAIAFTIDVGVPYFVLLGVWAAFEDPETGLPPDALSMTSLLVVLAYYVWNQGVLHGRIGLQRRGPPHAGAPRRAVSLEPIGTGRGVGHAFAQFVNLPVCGLGFWWPIWARNRPSPTRSCVRSCSCSTAKRRGRSERPASGTFWVSPAGFRDSAHRIVALGLGPLARALVAAPRG